jgi:phosphoribosylglycinamide formyltransferase-1
MVRLAILASHEGTTLQALIDACTEARLDAQLVAVISNNSRSGALRRAAAAGIPTHHISGKTHDCEDRTVLETCQQAQADWVLLLGYMKKLGEQTLAAYKGRILNTHPALLPKFGGQGYFGRRVHEAVIAAGERESGASVHVVDYDYDTGPILAQVRVPVLADDTPALLEDRVKAAEQQLLVATVAKLEP